MHKLRKITAVDALLASALFAQAPHAATVFIRLAAESGIFAIFHGVLYAAALEGATFHFVRTGERRWGTVFAVVSVLHNFAYYFHAGLSWDNAARAFLISLALPLAIATFSDARSKPATTPQEAQDSTAVLDVPQTEKAPEIDAQTPTEEADALPELTPRQRTILTLIREGYETKTAIAEVVKVHPATVGRDISAMQEKGVHLNGMGV